MTARFRHEFDNVLHLPERRAVIDRASSETRLIYPTASGGVLKFVLKVF